MAEESELIKKRSLLTCIKCHKKFLCFARAKGICSLNECRLATECTCENCNEANKISSTCKNVDIDNPSRRDGWYLNWRETNEKINPSKRKQD